MSEVTEKALKMRETVKEAFGLLGFDYELDNDGATFCFKVTGEDLAIPGFINVYNRCYDVKSYVPCDVGQDKMIDVILLCNYLNTLIPYGTVYYDTKPDAVIFRIEQFHDESLVSAEQVKIAVLTSLNIIDEFNDKFFMLVKGMISLEDAMKKVAEAF